MSKKTGIAIYILVVLHLVGTVGFVTPLRAWFEMLTPLNLILCAVVVIAFQERLSLRDAGAVGVIAALGILAEIAGVATGLVFGDYSYGETLGWKIEGVPWVIGINWVLLVWGAVACLHRFGWAKWLQAAVAATMMVILDVFIEPVAIELDFWSWAQGDVPLQNYVAWWVLGFAFALILTARSERNWSQDYVAQVFYLVQWLFFLPLWWLL